MDTLKSELAKIRLVGSLLPHQKKYLDAIQWLNSSVRGQGKTHLLCVAALLAVLDGRDGFVVDHYPYQQFHSNIRDLLFSIADDVKMKIEVTHVHGNVYKVSPSEKNIYRNRP